MERIETAAMVLARLRAREKTTDRATQRLNRHRHAVITLARQRAIKAIKQQFRAQGVRLNDVPCKVIHILADAYLDVHREQLVTEAEKMIATWPGFARWAQSEKATNQSLRPGAKGRADQ